MVKILAISILLTSAAYAADYSSNDFPRIVGAIYKVEGGAKTKYPYGIKSIKVKNTEEARRVCFNTVKNNYVRWIKAGKKNNFIEFLAARYCPPAADPVGHKNWVKNMKVMLEK